MEAVIYPKQLIVKFYEVLSESFPSEGFIYCELDAVLTGLYNSIRWSVLRLAESERMERITDLPTTSGFASKWMERQEIVERICDTSGLETEMSDICLAIIEDAVEQSLAEVTTVALPPIGRITRANIGYLIQLDQAFQPSTLMMTPRTAVAAAN